MSISVNFHRPRFHTSGLADGSPYVTLRDDDWNTVTIFADTADELDALGDAFKQAAEAERRADGERRAAA